MSLAVALTAHTSRLAAAERLADQLGARMFLDDGTLGEPGNTRAALRWLQGSGATHGLIIQDDAQPVGDFLQRAKHAINERPNHIISYYLGTGRPAQDTVARLVAQAEATHSNWVTMPRLWWGVAWSVPAVLLPQLNAWLTTHDGPTDSVTGRWMLHERQPCSYVWPCLVDHADEGSLVQHTYNPKNYVRKAWRVATVSA